MTPDDDVERQLRSRKQQSTDDDSAEIEAASFKKFPVEVNSLARVSTLVLYAEYNVNWIVITIFVVYIHPLHKVLVA